MVHTRPPSPLLVLSSHVSCVKKSCFSEVRYIHSSSSHKYDIFILCWMSENWFVADALLEDICRNGASVVHGSTALPWDRAPVKASVDVEKCLEGAWCIVLLRGSWGHGGEILTAELRPISTAADTRVSAESDLSPVHDSRVVGYEIVAVLAVLGDDGITGSPYGIWHLVAWAVAVIDLEEALTDHVGTDVADTVSSLAEGGCGCSVDDPWVGEDFLNCDPCCGTGIEHS